MLCVQNSETWAPNQAQKRTNFPQTEPVFHQNGATLSQRRSLFFPKMGHVLPKNGTCFGQKRSMFFPKTEHVFPNKFFQKRRFFPENGASQSRWLVSPKSVTDFPKVGDRFSQSRWRISPKSVTDFLKIGGRFPQTRGQISLKSVTDFPKSVTDFPEIGAKSVTDFPTEPSMFSIWFYKLFIFPPVSSFLFKPLQMKEFLRGQLQTLDITMFIVFRAHLHRKPWKLLLFKPHSSGGT